MSPRWFNQFGSATDLTFIHHERSKSKNVLAKNHIYLWFFSHYSKHSWVLHFLHFKLCRWCVYTGCLCGWMKWVSDCRQFVILCNLTFSCHGWHMWDMYSKSTHDHLLWGSITHSRMDLPGTIINQENELQNYHRWSNKGVFSTKVLPTWRKTPNQRGQWPLVNETNQYNIIKQ